jgi:hypothetical protein
MRQPAPVKYGAGCPRSVVALSAFAAVAALAPLTGCGSSGSAGSSGSTADAGAPQGDGTAPLDGGSARPDGASGDGSAPGDSGSGHAGDSGVADAAGDAPVTSPDGGSVVGPGMCIEDGWCWERPSFFGVGLNGVWGSSFDDVWAVGRGGTILHFDGSAWTRLPPITPEPLYHVHGSGKNDVWAVGRHVVLHWDGSAWKAVSAPATKGLLRTVFARAPGDVWFAGDWFALMHYDGSTFTLTEETTTQAAHAVVAFAANDVWAAGDSATVRHFDGTSWTWTGADFTNFPSCVSAWGSATNDVYLACGGGTDDTVQHWDGSAWHRVVFPAGLQPGPSVVTGSSSSDVWLISAEWNSASFDGTTWTRQPQLEGDALVDAWLDPASGRGFAVGAGGRIVRRDAGTTWIDVSGTKGAAYDDLVGAFARADDDIWAVGTQSLLRYDGHAWQPVPPAQTTNAQEFGTVWASASNDAWIAGWGDFPNSLQRWNGTAFSVMPGRPDLEGYIDGVWGAAANDVWIVADDGTVVHWDGSGLSMKLDNLGASGAGPGGVHGTGPSDVWMIGAGLHHWDGQSLTAVTTLPALPQFTTLAAVHATAPGDVWVTAPQGVVYRGNGTTWATPPVPTIRPDENGNVQLFGFDGTSAGDLWAVGTDGDVFHFDGSSWRKSMTAGVPISGLTRTPSGQLLAVGASGAILRRR